MSVHSLLEEGRSVTDTKPRCASCRTCRWAVFSVAAGLALIAFCLGLRVDFGGLPGQTNVPFELGTGQSARVLILQHFIDCPPGYLGDWLEQQGVAADVPCTERGEPFPASVKGYMGMAVLGGDWSANDDRPSLRQAEALIREANDLGIPVIGHCLGGQLIAKALGGRVERNPVLEVGWEQISIHASSAARQWFGNYSTARLMDWHEDTFAELPPGAVSLASSGACKHQAFSLGPHLAMQFHIEVTKPIIADWLVDPGQAYEQAVKDHLPSVQSPEVIDSGTVEFLNQSHHLGHVIFSRWQANWKK